MADSDIVDNVFGFAAGIASWIITIVVTATIYNNINQFYATSTSTTTTTPVPGIAGINLSVP